MCDVIHADWKFPLGEDLHSWSNFKEVVSRHLSIVLTVDLKRQVFSGYVDHSVEVLVDNATEVLFDTKYLAIEGVYSVNSDGIETPLLWTLPKYLIFMK